MKRIHGFEFTDLPWYPSLFRRIQTDYLQFVATLSAAHGRLIPLLRKAMECSGTRQIVDLCSGTGGPWIRLKEQFEQAGLNVVVTLTDKYPDPETIQSWSASSQQGIRYLAEPVDALNVPSNLKGMRTLFEGFHHFNPERAQAILRDAAQRKIPIGIFEASLKPPFGALLLLLAPLTTLVSYFLLTPFIQPRTLSRFFWTYLIPIVPLATSWDGVVSFLRVYSPAELEQLVNSFVSEDYTWETGQASTGTPIFTFTYLIGHPARPMRQ